MSLSIAIQQIQLPTWWIIETPHQKRMKSAKKTPSEFFAERKLVVLAAIAELGMATQDEIAEKTGINRGRLFYAMKELKEEKAIYCAKITPCKGGRIHHWGVKK